MTDWRVAWALIGAVIGGLIGLGGEPFSLSRLLNVAGACFWTGVMGYALGGASAEEWRRVGPVMAAGAILALGLALSMNALTLDALVNTVFALLVGGLIAKNWAWRAAANTLMVGALTGACVGLGISLAEGGSGVDLLKAAGGGALGFALFLFILRGVLGFGQDRNPAAADTPRARIESWTRVIILDRTNSEAYYNRGKAYAEAGETELARADFHRAHESSGTPRWHALAEQALRQLDQDSLR
ncbi:MAG TPA: tetratricopeptide repeat protein [Herpetosiphonaceae bacterium]|nr:tetratricopeptide repeat protein [Herpetosiphonaceae bacterium]